MNGDDRLASGGGESAEAAVACGCTAGEGDSGAANAALPDLGMLCGVLDMRSFGGDSR